MSASLSAAAQQDVVGQAVSITLANGSIVSGTVTKREGGKVTLKADLIGEVVIEEKDIAGFGPAPTAAPVKTGPAAQTMTPQVTWTTTGTAGYNYFSAAAPALTGGADGTHGVNLSITTERSSEKDAFSLSGEYTYQRTKPADAAANNGSVTMAYNHQLNKQLTLITRTTLAKDDVKHINARFNTLEGIGFMPIQTSKVTLSIVPGVGYTKTDYEINAQLAPLFAGVKDSALGYGVFDYLKIDLMPTLTFHQTFMHLHSFSTSSQYVSEAQFSLVGLVSPKVGISLTYSMNYDSQMPEPYIKKKTSTFMSGLQFKF